MSTLADTMNLETHDQKIDKIVKEYEEATQRGKEHFIHQTESILLVLEAIESVEWDKTSVDWNNLVRQMRDWCRKWELRLTKMYEEHLRTRLAQHPEQAEYSDDARYAVATLMEPQVDLISHEDAAFAMFGAEQWTAKFITYTKEFIEALELFRTHLRNRIEKGRQHATISYTSMQFTYLQLLQHLYDVPTINDAGKMQYEVCDDPSMMQQKLQEDEGFKNILKYAGQCVLWHVDDVMNPEYIDLPDLFYDMIHFYDYIKKKLQPVIPIEDQFFNNIEEFDADLENDEVQEAEFEEQHSQEQTQPMRVDLRDDQRAEMTSLIRQLQQMNSARLT